MRTLLTLSCLTLVVGIRAESFYAEYASLSAFSDTSNLSSSRSIYRMVYARSEEDPDTYINDVSIVPGSVWDSGLDLYTVSGSMTGSNGTYEFGRPLSGNYWNAFGVAFRMGSAPVGVAPGIYDFSIEVVGGLDPSATDTLATIHYALEVSQKLEVVAFGTSSPSAVAPGQKSYMAMTVQNNESRTVTASAWYQGYVPAGVTDSIFPHMDVDFDHSQPWSGFETVPGGSTTRAHSVATCRANTPTGTYSMYGGWMGGYYPGDQHFVPMSPAPQVTAVPEPTSLAVIGFALLALGRRRHR